MSRFKAKKRPFQGKKKQNSRKKVTRNWCQARKEYLNKFNEKESWFGQNDWDTEESTSRRKILLPEEDINEGDDSCLSDDSFSSDDEELIEQHLKQPNRYVAINFSTLNNFFNDSVLCKECNQSITLYEDVNKRHGLGTKIIQICSQSCSRNTCGFQTSENIKGSKVYDINKRSCLALRSIGRGHTSALKLFSLMNFGKPVSRRIWTNYTSDFVERADRVAAKNMKLAASELSTPDSTTSTPTSFDCSWNSRGWQAKQGVVAAISQDNGKIIDVIHKVSFCRDCKFYKEKRDTKEISSLEYLVWFVSHEKDCQLNHTGSPQVC